MTSVKWNHLVSPSSLSGTGRLVDSGQSMGTITLVIKLLTKATPGPKYVQYQVEELSWYLYNLKRVWPSRPSMMPV